MLNRDQALQKMEEWVKSQSLRNHCRAVEVAMRKCAHVYGTGITDEERFGLAGMCHDIDWEKFPAEHPKMAVEWLKAMNEPEIAAAVAAHGTAWGKPYDTVMARALVATDELCGLVVACAKVRPDGIRTLTPKSVLKKFKDSSFAANVDRSEIYSGLRILGVEIDPHVQVIIDALMPCAEELGIAGTNGAPGIPLPSNEPSSAQHT